jgi:SH3 domain-containing YSC84-like protein 1
MKGLLFAALLLPTAMLARDARERLTDATDVFGEVMAAPDKGIPQDLLNKAYCVVIVPGVKKAAFVVGGEYGRGFAVCRREHGTGWGPPASLRMEGGSVGFQIGASSTDLIMLVMNRHGMEQLLRDKFTLGGDASVTAGPVGRTADANTDALMTAEILAWSRAKGLFAGVSLAGSTLRNDLDSNAELYGQKLDNREVLMTARPVPPAAERLIHTLDRYSMRKEGTADREHR